MEKSHSKRKKIIWIIISSLFIISLVAGVIIYQKIYSPFFNIKKTVYIYVDDNQNYNDLLSQLQDTAHIKDIELFKKLASFSKYPLNMKTGRYAIKPGMNVRELLRILENGIQTPVKLTFNNIRLKNDFAERIGKQLMLSSDSLLVSLNDSVVCEKFGFNNETILCMFIPNTYEVYWNIDVNHFLQKMKKEYDKFWNQDRLKAAQNIPLSPVQVSILASIVEEETASSKEYPIVAGLYINRLKQGMLLQADPTVKYAVGDFGIRRVLNIHLATDSPYNTYKNPGLPPGPIRIPSIKGIDAVLNYSQHNYIYMCAKEDFSGQHNFASTLAEHNRNADLYRAALNRKNIRY